MSVGMGAVEGGGDESTLMMTRIMPMVTATYHHYQFIIYGSKHGWADKICIRYVSGGTEKKNKEKKEQLGVQSGSRRGVARCCWLIGG